VQVSKSSFLDHIKLFRQAAQAAGGEALLSFDSMTVYLRRGGAHWQFQPKFLTVIDGVRQYASTLADDTMMFAGWLPYQMKRWQIAADKLAFKRYAQAAGLQTPAHWLVAGECTDVLAKQAVSSFGASIAGPFRSSSEHALDVARAEYFEQFIPGRILKVWFWDEAPVCAEIDTMPFVLGDGRSTLAALITRRANMNRRRTEEELQRLLAQAGPVLRFYGVELATVLPEGKRQLIEFKYGSVVMHRRDRKVVDLTQPHKEKWAVELDKIGSKLASGIPAEIRRHTMFTVDAIVDKDNQVWLLEMNCNPTVHPLAYPRMVTSLVSGTEQDPNGISTAAAGGAGLAPQGTAQVVQ
jgi:hypothetical protein